LAQGFKHRQAVAVGQPQIEDHQIGAVQAAGRHGLVAGRSGGDHLQTALTFEQPLQQLQKHQLVFDD
jgi:hypothetical protein